MSKPTDTCVSPVRCSLCNRTYYVLDERRLHNELLVSCPHCHESEWMPPLIDSRVAALATQQVAAP